MKKFFLAIAVAAIIGLGFGINQASAGGSLYPYADGADIMVPDDLIKAIPNYEPGKPVYACTNYNGWCGVNEKFNDQARLAKTVMLKEGDVWRAKGMGTQCFHPGQLSPTGIEGVNWAKIEDMYDLNEADFIEHREKGPCIKFKK